MVRPDSPMRESQKMTIRRRLWVVAVSATALALPGLVSGLPARADGARGPAAPGHCSAGAHTLSHLGDHVYPDTGNGGYTSLHTDIHMVYDAASNQFLPGNHVDL